MNSATSPARTRSTTSSSVKGSEKPLLGFWSCTVGFLGRPLGSPEMESGGSKRFPKSGERSGRKMLRPGAPKLQRLGCRLPCGGVNLSGSESSFLTNKKPSRAKTVLLVDDSAYWTDTIADGLRREGYVVSVLYDGLAAVERLRKSPPEILITDYFLANLDGGKLCQLAKRLGGDPPITTIILTGGADRKQSRAPSMFADAVIAKNATHIVFEDLRRALGDLRHSLPPLGDVREVIGHERLEPRAIASKLHGLKQYLDALHEGIGDAVIGVDTLRRVYFLNSVALEVFDLKEEDALARPVEQVLGVPSDHPLAAAIGVALEKGGSPRRPMTVELERATLRVTVAGLKSPDGQTTAMVIARDISDLKAAELARLAFDARLHEADKLASLGHLVAGVSHEINNPLAAILLNLPPLQEAFDEVAAYFRGTPAPKGLVDQLDEIPRILQESVSATARIRAIVEEMRLFAHPRGDVGEAARVEELLDVALALVSNEVRFKARVERVYSETPRLVVDRTRLIQAFLNVLLNAAQAIEGHDPDGAWIRVEARSEAHGVLAVITNSGPPIPKDILPRIFEPFFTTKPVGQGVGLGLSISYDTVRRHGGHIEAASGPDQPTSFRIWLPCNTGLALAPPSELLPAEAMPVRPARILFVDDERLLQSSIRRILERHHEVVLASSGHRALEILAHDRFDVILCDLIMPGMNGMLLYETVKALMPEQAARFVFLTGGTSSSEARDFLLSVDNPRAYKPLSADEIMRLIARCLAQFSSNP
jgi:signal transduction histidine kinase/DNA-binding response OmpR family regulator